MKKFILILLSVLFCFSLASCTVETKETTDIETASPVTVAEPDFSSLDEYKKDETETVDTVTEAKTSEPISETENPQTETPTVTEPKTETAVQTPSGNNTYTKPQEQKPQFDGVYYANKNTKKFHKSTCGSAKLIKDTNLYTTTSRDELINEGYVPCARCNP